MATFAKKTSHHSSTVLFFFFFLLLLIFPTVFALDAKKPCKRFVLHYHDVLYRDGDDPFNATSALVTNYSKISNFEFGMIVVFDDPVTEDQSLNSPPAAKAQGIYIYDMRTDYSAFFAFTLIFNSTEYKGTINIVGSDFLRAKTRDLSVVGGTGDFFMTRGIVTLSSEAIEGFKYFRLNMDVKLYECYQDT